MQHYSHRSLKQRCTLQFLSAVLAICAAGTSVAQVVTLSPVITGITGTAERMISYRHQEHSWQTSDGGIHLLVNRGTVPTGDSLVLYSSYDAGATWTPVITLPDSDAVSTGDGTLVTVNGTANLLVVYGTSQATQNIMYKTLTYNSAARTWTVASTQTVFTSPAVAASNPALGIDSAGIYWAVYTAQDRATLLNQEQLSYRAMPSKTWTSTPVVFGGTDNSLQHSARPIAYRNGIAMIYEDGQTLYWAYRLTGWAVTAPWVSFAIGTGLPAPSQNPYGSHFSAVADGAGNIHLAYVANQQLVYRRYLSSTDTWGATRPMTPSTIQAAYVQAVLAGSNVMLMVNYMQSIEVLQSTDAGNTFAFTQALVHARPPTGSTLSYNNPRIEAPSHATSPVPTWQQYVDGTTQGLMFFQVPTLP